VAKPKGTKDNVDPAVAKARSKLAVAIRDYRKNDAAQAAIEMTEARYRERQRKNAEERARLDALAASASDGENGDAA